jgi:hypothetical protein
MNMSRVAIIGSRDFVDYKVLSKTINDCHKIIAITHIISGGAKGADSLGARWAKENNVELIEYLPDWDRYGKSAGFKRNTTIIESADFVIAFWDMKSKGTADSIRKALNFGLNVLVYDFIAKKLSWMEL